MQSGARLEAVRSGGARRRPAGRQRAVREARRLAQEQVLAGEPQVDDRHGRRRPHPRRHDLLELFPPAGTAADVLPASAAAAATGPGRRAGRRVGGRGRRGRGRLGRRGVVEQHPEEIRMLSSLEGNPQFARSFDARYVFTLVAIAFSSPLHTQALVACLINVSLGLDYLPSIEGLSGSFVSKVKPLPAVNNSPLKNDNE